VSFLFGDGYTDFGAIVRLWFKEGATDYIVRGGTETRWPEVFGCDNAPDIYGVLASPDLNGDLAVDAGDTGAFAQFYGDTITRSHAWGADFNHEDASIDASDTAYFSGRVGTDCAGSKPNVDSAGPGAFEMNAANLERDDVVALLALAHLTATDVIGIWDSEGWSYDEDTAARVAGTQTPQAIESRPWSRVKQMYR